MNSNPIFSNQSSDFWAYVRLISDIGHYSLKGKVKSFSASQITDILEKKNLNVTPDILKTLTAYFSYRQNILNNYVEPRLIDLAESKRLYQNLLNSYIDEFGEKRLPVQPLNKQKGDKKNVAFFTAQINLLTSRTLNHLNKTNSTNVRCNYDPRNLTHFTNKNNTLSHTLTRRFDGAIPDVINPYSIWEIKEYYYTTTFGSRISDGVYETQLDGYEIMTMRQNNEPTPSHAYLIDSHFTWWNGGKSYLCRIIDALNIGLVDTVFFGKEIYESWEDYITDTYFKIINEVK